MAITLLRHGCDYEIYDYENKKAVDIALENDFKEMVNAVNQHHSYANKRRAAASKS